MPRDLVSNEALLNPESGIKTKANHRLSQLKMLKLTPKAINYDNISQSENSESLADDDDEESENDDQN